MHKSRLAGFIIDCETPDLAAAGAFWGAALGMGADPAAPPYVRLEAAGRDLAVEVQTVAHVSRVHLDLSTDDLEAEVKRLEALGARRVEHVRHWWVMEAPTGHRFCVVEAKPGALEGKAGVTTWGDG